MRPASRLLAPLSVSAQTGLTLSGGIGHGDVDETFGVEEAVPIAARAGIVFWRYVAFEGTYVWIHGDGARAPSEEIPLRHIGAGLIVNLLPTFAVNPDLPGRWEGRWRNRRVEFRVLNPEALR